MQNSVKILYVHGLNGHENGSAINLVFKELIMSNLYCDLDAPRLPVTDPDAMNHILPELFNDYDVIVASSLGAFYTLQQTNVTKILVNPALPENIETLNEPSITPENLEKLKHLKDNFFNNIFNDNIDKETYFVFGDNDTVAPNSSFFENMYKAEGHTSHINMAHKVDETGAQKIVEIIKELYKDNPEVFKKSKSTYNDASMTVSSYSESNIPEDVKTRFDKLHRLKEKYGK